MPKPEAEVDVTSELLRALLRDQHPDLADLPIDEVATGWDNLIYRLGEDLVARLPRRLASAELVLHEQRWLPELAVDLPLAVPTPVRVGVPGCGYPWAWSVCPWIPGVEIERQPPADWLEVARQLGDFLGVLHRPAPPDAPANPYRGIPLPERTERLMAGLDQLGDTVDRARLTKRWAEVVDIEPWGGPPLWLHGDVHPLNLLVHAGRLSGVIDFGDVTAGDPASDLAVAWMLLPQAARPEFRAASGTRYPVDDALWSRAQGWAIALGVAMANGDEPMAAIGRRALHAVLAESD